MLSRSSTKPSGSQANPNTRKRDYENESDESVLPIKLPRTEAEDLYKKSPKIFLKACKQVSYEAYNDIRKRSLLTYLPDCIEKCTHSDNPDIKQITSNGNKSFKTEMDNYSWYEALEVCFISTTPVQYLSDNMLKDILEIMMNANEDFATEYTIQNLLQRCQQALTLHFNMHPPCEFYVQKCYLKFLTSPMEEKLNTPTNRTEYSSESGIVAYCFKRLLYEICADSKDGIIIEKKAIPKEFEDSVKSLHWKKQNHELFEFLQRTDRIERLMLVLESVIDLLQCNLAIFLSRSSSSRRTKPLISSILWQDNRSLSTQQNILKVFVYFVHLQYPEHHIKTMNLWVNTLAEAVYMKQIYSDSDYPNASTEYTSLVKEFHRLLLTIPSKSASKVLEMIRPSFLQQLVGLSYANTLFETKYTDILSLIVSRFTDLPLGQIPEQRKLDLLNMYKEDHPITEQSLSKCLSKIFEHFQLLSQNDTTETAINPYPKFNNTLSQSDSESSESVIEILCMCLIANLEANSLKKLRTTVISLNEKVQNEGISQDKSENNFTPTYSVHLDRYKRLASNLKQLKLNCTNDTNDKPIIKTISTILNNYS